MQRNLKQYFKWASVKDRGKCPCCGLKIQHNLASKRGFVSLVDIHNSTILFHYDCYHSDDDADSEMDGREV